MDLQATFHYEAKQTSHSITHSFLPGSCPLPEDFLQNFIYYLPRRSLMRLPKYPQSPKLRVFVSNSNSTSSSKGHICQALVFAPAAATKQQQPATTERCQAASSAGFGRKCHDGAPHFTTAFKGLDGLWSISLAQKNRFRFYIKFIYVP